MNKKKKKKNANRSSDWESVYSLVLATFIMSGYTKKYTIFSIFILN